MAVDLRSERVELFTEQPKLFVVELLEHDEVVPRASRRPNELVELRRSAAVSRFWVYWIRKTTKKVTMVAPPSPSRAARARCNDDAHDAELARRGATRERSRVLDSLRERARSLLERWA